MWWGGNNNVTTAAVTLSTYPSACRDPLLRWPRALCAPGLWLWCCWSSCILAQPTETGNYLRFDRVQKSGNIQVPRVSAIAQDRFGFIWIGTNDGLLRYDGYRLRAYRNRAGDAASLPSNTVTDVLSDRRGELWIGSRQGGLCRYDPASDGFEAMALPGDPDLPFDPRNISCLAEGPGGILWLGFRGKVRSAGQFDPVTRTFTLLDLRPSEGEAPHTAAVRDILVDNKHDVWLAFRNTGLLRYRPASGEERRSRPSR